MLSFQKLGVLGATPLYRMKNFLFITVAQVGGVVAHNLGIVCRILPQLVLKKTDLGTKPVFVLSLCAMVAQFYAQLFDRDYGYIYLIIPIVHSPNNNYNKGENN